MKKKKKGFSYMYKDTTFNVYFESFNNRIVKCILSDDDGNEYIGISKVNIDEGDVFIENEGQRVSMFHALRKWDKEQSRIFKIVQKEIVNTIGNVNCGLTKKLENLIRKEKI